MCSLLKRFINELVIRAVTSGVKSKMFSHITTSSLKLHGDSIIIL